MTETDSDKLDRIRDILGIKRPEGGTERSEKLTMDYIDRARSLQRHYLIVFGLSVAFLLLFSFLIYRLITH